MLLLKISLLVVFSLINSSQCGFGETISNISQLITCNNTSKFNFVIRSGTHEFYYVVDILLNWIDAESFCQKFGAHLPSISVQSDLDFLRGIKLIK